MENAFRSRRLVFRALESPEDDAYFMESQQDYAGLANSTRGLLLPSSKKSVEEYKNYLQEKCLLAVVVCLPAPAVHEAANNGAQVKHAKEDGKSKSEVLLQARSIPIGIIALSKPPEHMAHHRWADIGLTFLPAYQGMGYGSESIEWILQWGFQIAGLHRIGHLPRSRLRIIGRLANCYYRNCRC